MFLSFVEDVVYGDAFDTSLRAGCRAFKSPGDCLELEAMQVAFEKVTQQHEAEIKRRDAQGEAPESQTQGTPDGGGDGAADTHTNKVAGKEGSQTAWKR